MKENVTQLKRQLVIAIPATTPNVSSTDRQVLELLSNPKSPASAVDKALAAAASENRRIIEKTNRNIALLRKLSPVLQRGESVKNAADEFLGRPTEATWNILQKTVTQFEADTTEIVNSPIWKEFVPRSTIDPICIRLAEMMFFAIE